MAFLSKHSSFVCIVGFISLITSCQQKVKILEPTSLPIVAVPSIITEKKITSKENIISSIDTTTYSQAPVQKILPTKLHKISHQGIQFNLVTFDSRKQSLVVVDQTKGPGTIYTDSQATTKALNGIAAINAGFFTPEGKPLGLVITQGNKRGSYNTSSLGSGIFYQTSQGHHLKRRSIWTKLSKNPPAELLQSGPMLLENSKSIVGLSDEQGRVRSFIATDGKSHWCIGHASSCTLNELSKTLTTIKIDSFKPTTALNLDGGRSSDLWVSSTVNNGPLKIRPFWNKDVRNFLVLKNK